MNLEIIKFEELHPVITSYTDYADKLEKAKAFTTAQMSLVDKVDIKNVGVEFMETALEPVIKLRSLLTKRRADWNSIRTPYTQKMDAIAAVLIKNEKDWDDLIAIPKKRQDEWEMEKLRRKKESEKKAADDLLLARAKIVREGNLKSKILKAFSDALSIKMIGLNKAFYAKSATDLPVYAGAIKSWTPILTEEFWTSDIALKAIAIEDIDIKDGVVSSVYFDLCARWKASLEAERDRLYDLVPSRLNELKQPVIAPTEARIAAVAETVASEVGNLIQAEESVTELRTITAGFTSAPAEELNQAKGSVKKMKYVADSHKGIATIIQSWVEQDLQRLTIEEATKKLSFMFTAANSRLNAKKDSVLLKSEGLETIEDVSTRNQR